MRYGLNANVWLSPLMILGTQWYILFNVIAGASAFPTDLREAAGSFHLKGWRWWVKVVLPGIFPVLHHRRDHRVGRLVERLDRRGSRKLGRHPSDRQRSRRLYRDRDRSRRLPARRARHRRDVHSGDAVQPAALEAALRLRRAAPSSRLIARGSHARSSQTDQPARYPRRLPLVSEGQRRGSAGAGKSRPDDPRRARSSACSAAPDRASRRCCASSPA